MTGFAEPGTRTVNLDVTSLTPGLYIVNVKEDGVSREGCRLLIR